MCDVLSLRLMFVKHLVATGACSTVACLNQASAATLQHPSWPATVCAPAHRSYALSASSQARTLLLQVQAVLLHAWIKLQLPHFNSPLGLQQLTSHMHQLQAAKPEAALLRPLWKTLTAAAAASNEPAAAAFRGFVADSRAQADEDSAEVEAELAAVKTLEAYNSGQKLQVLLVAMVPCPKVLTTHAADATVCHA